jgi:hypothetical protein
MEKHPAKAVTLDLIWKIYGIPTPQEEYRFHPKRRWRFDYCWPNRRIAVEREGGIWNAGRHIRPRGYLLDAEKYNEATRLGWQIYRFTPAQFKTGEAQTFMRLVFQPTKDEYSL